LKRAPTDSVQNAISRIASYGCEGVLDKCSVHDNVSIASKGKTIEICLRLLLIYTFFSSNFSVLPNMRKYAINPTAQNKRGMEKSGDTHDAPSFVNCATTLSLSTIIFNFGICMQKKSRPTIIDFFIHVPPNIPEMEEPSISSYFPSGIRLLSSLITKEESLLISMVPRATSRDENAITNDDFAENSTFFENVATVFGGICKTPEMVASENTVHILEKCDESPVFHF
jgi:hypothetical protein